MDGNFKMEGIKSIFTLCLWMGGLGLCIVLIVSAVLRWLAPQGTRAKRLNGLAGLAAVILCLICLAAVWGTVGTTAAAGGTDGSAAAAVNAIGDFAEISKLTIRLLLLGIMIVSVLMLLFVVVIFLKYGLKVIFAAGTAGVADRDCLEEYLKEISRGLTSIMRTPVLVAVIAWGILALFIAFPFLMGSSEHGDMTEAWVNGVEAIVSFGSGEGGNAEASDDSTRVNQAADTANSSSEGTFSAGTGGSSKVQGTNDNSAHERFDRLLIKYILLFVIVLGVVFAVFKLLYSIILQNFTEANKKALIDEYSSAIGVLSVGVAMLWTLQDHVQLLEDPGQLLLEFFKAFCVVMLIVALIILTLEIIRLLLDMRQRLIRQEAKFLFIILVGQGSLLLLSMMGSIYDAVSKAMGNLEDDSLERIQCMIKKKVVKAMEEELSGKEEFKVTFAPFDEKITKDDAGEER